METIQHTLKIIELNWKYIKGNQKMNISLEIVTHDRSRERRGQRELEHTAVKNVQWSGGRSEGDCPQTLDRRDELGWEGSELQ